MAKYPKWNDNYDDNGKHIQTYMSCAGFEVAIQQFGEFKSEISKVLCTKNLSDPYLTAFDCLRNLYSETSPVPSHR
jgi:hypothetical protein